MHPERWRQVKAILQSALDRPSDERGHYLDTACAGDADLRQTVETLVASYEESGNLVEMSGVPDAEKLPPYKSNEMSSGQRLGRYRVISKLGEGGMGEVLLAEDMTLGRRAALKLLPAQLAGDNSRLQRFKQEARAASALNHPNIITIYEIGEIDGRAFIATEFIDGETLRERLGRSQMTLGEVLDTSVQAASALTAAHAAGITHRDIKPENIMVRRDGIAKVLDFGLAKLVERGAGGTEVPTLVRTDEGVVMGTVLYMSPEQARGLPVDERTDVWSLGIVIYEMIAGQVPFSGATSSDAIAAILGREAMPLVRYAPETPAELQRIVKKALAKDREERYQLVKEVGLDLKNLRRELDLQARLDLTANPTHRRQIKSLPLRSRYAYPRSPIQVNRTWRRSLPMASMSFTS